MNDTKGSIWRKWDLHIHTPASFHWKGARFAQKTPKECDVMLDELIDRIVQSDVVAFGIMDYWTFDGYLAITDRLRTRKLSIEKAIFPGMELRIEAPVDFRLNIQVILSDSLTRQQLQDFKASLRIGSIDRTLSDESLVYFASTLDRSKAKVHGFEESDLRNEEKLLQLGSMTAKVTRESLRQAITQIPADTCLVIMPYDTSDGLSKLDWQQHPYDDNYFMQSANIFETREPNNVDLFLGRETDKNREFLGNFLKTMGGRPKAAISGSDAHKITDYGVFPNDRITWIKADPTYEGLLQVVNEPIERSFIGEIPPKLDHVQKNKTKYINMIRLQRKPTAMIAEVWFDNVIPLNMDLVAIIGNKGKGKSALTDTIGLLCNTKQYADLTFLSDKHFRQPKDNKAKHFQATLTWESGATVTKGLDEAVDEQQPESVKYIPQNFLENICTQLGEIEETDFDRELKKVIFSHVEIAERLGKASLDELIAYKTSEATSRIHILKQELHAINEAMVALEDRATPEHRQKIENILKVKQDELAVHAKSKPAVVAKPANDPVKQKEIADVAAEIEAKKKELAKCEKKINEASEGHAKLVQLIATTDRLLARLENLKRQLQTFSSESRADLASLGIKEEAVLKVIFDKKPLSDKRNEFVEQKTKFDAKLDSENSGSLIHAKLKIKKNIDKLKAKLDEPNKKFQTYQATLAEWEKKKQVIIGKADANESIKFYERQLKDLDTVPQQLIDCKARCMSKAKEIHAVIRQLIDTYRELYAPVNQFIEKRPLAKDKFQLNFEVGIVDTGFMENFFDTISHAVIGTFCGVEEGNKRLKDILSRHDFNSEEGTEAFLTEIVDALENDKRPDGKRVKVTDQIRKGKSRLQLYDMLFSLDYMNPRYVLMMGGKELYQLSPGERGALLLVFYLLVDKDDIPLVIDQPEENLDNQTIYELLVPCIKEAKQRRQIFIVTHNPNLAVVCDAEQIICADLDKKGNYRMNYLSGAIENPIINNAIVDVLEGTMPAFDNRDSKYLPSER